MNNLCREVCRSDSAFDPNKTVKVLLLCCAMMLSACGNKGDLYIPQEPEEQTAAVDLTMTADTSTKERRFE